MEMQTCILISQAIMKVHNESVAFIHVNLRYRPFPIDPDDFAREFVVGICSGPGGGEVVCYRFCESGGGEEEKYTKQLLRKSHVARKCQQHAHCFVPADERALVYNISNEPCSIDPGILLSSITPGWRTRAIVYSRVRYDTANCRSVEN